MAGPTQALLDDVLARLRAALPDLAADYFPDDPGGYRVNHPVGTLLVSYAGARFGATADVMTVAQDRDARLTVTTIVRQLNGRLGAVEVLDRVRTALVGFRPAGAVRPMRGAEEKFLAQADGLWHYATTFAVGLTQIEDRDYDTEDPFAGLAGMEETIE